MSLRCVTGTNSLTGLIASVYSGLGIRGDAIPNTGGDGPSPVYPMLSLPADAAKEYRLRNVTMLTSGASVQTYENLSAVVTPPTGMTNGVVRWQFDLQQDGTGLGTSLQRVFVGSVTLWEAGADVIAGGWTPSTGASLSACIDETTLSRADWITSPDLSTPCTLAWDASLPAGTYDAVVDAAYTGSSGQLRVVALDAGGASVGASPWQSLTSTDTTYSLVITTSATSTQFRLEVQA